MNYLTIFKFLLLFTSISISNLSAQINVIELKVEPHILANKKIKSNTENFNHSLPLLNKVITLNPASKLTEIQKKITTEQVNNTTPNCLASIDFANVYTCVSDVANGNGTITVFFSQLSCNVQPENFDTLAGMNIVNIVGFDFYLGNNYIGTKLESPTVFNNTACEPFELNLLANNTCNTQTASFEVIAQLYTFQIINGIVSNVPIAINPFPNCINETFDLEIYPSYSLVVNNSNNCSVSSIAVISPDQSICANSLFYCTTEGETFEASFVDPNSCNTTTATIATCTGCPINGCTDFNFCNYNPLATNDDGSCLGLIVDDLDCDGISDDCIPNLILNANPELAQTYQADNFIISSSKIYADTVGTVNYYAGDDFILLNNNFFADSSMHFNAEIIDCNPND